MIHLVAGIIRIPRHSTSRAYQAALVSDSGIFLPHEFTASFNPLAGLDAGTEEAGIFRLGSVLWLRPVLAGRFSVRKVPNSAPHTSFQFAKVSPIILNAVSTEFLVLGHRRHGAMHACFFRHSGLADHILPNIGVWGQQSVQRRQSPDTAAPVTRFSPCLMKWQFARRVICFLSIEVW